MNRSIATRLEKLENVSRAGRQFILWDNSALDPLFDLEAEKERLRREQGITDQDSLVIIGWRSPAIMIPPSCRR